MTYEWEGCGDDGAGADWDGWDDGYGSTGEQEFGVAGAADGMGMWEFGVTGM